MKQTLYFLSVLVALSSTLVAQEKPIKVAPYLGDMSARQIGPAQMSGRVIDLEPHPTNSRIFYVGSAGGGVWKTNLFLRDAVHLQSRAICNDCSGEYPPL